MEIENAKLFEALGHANRLAVFRLLARRYPQFVPAGEIAQALGYKPNTLSTYVSALIQANLIEKDRKGTSVRYRVAIENAKAMIDFLALDCLRGRPDVLAGVQAEQGAAALPTGKKNVLFLCTANSARSIFAQALLTHLAGDRFNVYSAGSHPAGQVNARALALLQDRGLPVDGLRSKDLYEYRAPNAPVMDFVFTVCDRAANEECPSWDGQPISGHWSIPDPVAVTGPEDQVRQAFEAAYQALKRHILAFVALPTHRLPKAELQRCVDHITNPSFSSRSRAASRRSLSYRPMRSTS